MRKLGQLSALLIAALLSTAVQIPDENEQAGACLVSTSYGDVQGLNQGTTCAFLGIPYVAPPTGNNRWRPPQPAAPWAPTVLNATTPPPNCPTVFPAGAPQGVEDCLKLNIWVSNPAPSDPVPVIVWLHTGAFFAASANFAPTNGRRLAEEKGVIVVEPNYRLGPFGFLAHEAFEDEDPDHPSTGNYGLLDQRAALQWVRDNIAQFGGDPNNVTIGGTSAGGQSVGLHLVSPGSGGLFEGAIIQSAYPTSRWNSREEGLAQGDAFATSLGCTDPAQVLTCMRSKTRDQVLLALTQAFQQVAETPGRVYWEPIVDGVVIPDQPRSLFEQGDYHHVPTLIGVNRDEGWGNFITRSFPSPVTLAQYEAWVGTEFGANAASVLALYPAADFTSPQEAMARVIGDGQFICEARRLSTLISDGGLRGQGPHENHGTGKREKVPVFLYSYEYELDDISLDHVIHGVETNIIFGNNYAPPSFPAHVLNATDLALHAIMAGYWTRFAATGDPNNEQVLEWPVYRKNHEGHIIFDAVTTTDENLGGGTCDFWSNFFFRSMLIDVPAASN
jgi:para-nitrobenzyl esterase